MIGQTEQQAPAGRALRPKHRRAALASPQNSSKVISNPLSAGQGRITVLSLIYSLERHVLQDTCSRFSSCLQSEVDDFCQSWDEALQREERRQSEDSHRDNSRISRSAVTVDNPVWQKMR